MADSNSERLADKQIRDMMQEFNSDVTKLSLSLAIFQKALMNKGLLTESDIAAATEQVDREAKETIAKIASATRRGPGKEIQ